MAKLLIRTVDGENALRYMRGDVVAAFPDDHVFGRMESLVVWAGEGRNPDDWPGGFAVVELDGLSVADASRYIEEQPVLGATKPEMARRRKWSVDYEALERRSPLGGRDTLRTEARIKRRWSDSDVPELFKLKA